MNRDFYIETVTPATARKMVSALVGTNAYIDPKIMAKVREDLIEHEDNTIRDLMQFIKDHDLRCLIPYEHSVVKLREAVVKSIPEGCRVLFFDDPVNWNRLLGERVRAFDPQSKERFQFLSTASVLSLETSTVRSLCEQRDMLVIARAEYPEYMEWMGRLFNKLILYCEVEKQFSMFNRNNFTNKALVAASILYPHLTPSASILSARPFDKVIPLCGGTNKLLYTSEEKILHKRTKTNGK